MCSLLLSERPATRGAHDVAKLLGRAVEDLLLARAPSQNQSSDLARAPSQNQSSDSVDTLLHEICTKLGSRQDDEADSGCKPSCALVFELLECNLPVQLLACLEHLSFEARKDAANLLSEVLSGRAGTGDRLAEYFRASPNMAQGLLDSCVQQEVFFLGSQILRAATQCPQLVAVLLEGGFLLKLMDLCFHQSFEVSNEVFASLRELLLNQKFLAAHSMQANFDEFFQLYHLLLQQEKDYVLQRQALKLLGQFLLDCEFQCVMMPYVQSEHFLQIHMKLLVDHSQAIPLDAFHIFKLFVANPHKVRSVQKILARNGTRLIKLLEKFRHMQDDDGFRQDLDMVLGMIDGSSSP